MNKIEIYFWNLFFAVIPTIISLCIIIDYFKNKGDF